MENDIAQAIVTLGVVAFALLIIIPKIGYCYMKNSPKINHEKFRGDLEEKFVYGVRVVAFVGALVLFLWAVAVVIGGE